VDISLDFIEVLPFSKWVQCDFGCGW
jgi:hypothetical protein